MLLFNTELLVNCGFFVLVEFIVSFRTFLAGWKTIMYIFGVNKHTRMTVALRLIDTLNVVIWICEEKPNKFNMAFTIFIQNQVHFTFSSYFCSYFLLWIDLIIIVLSFNVMFHHFFRLVDVWAHANKFYTVLFCMFYS